MIPLPKWSFNSGRLFLAFGGTGSRWAYAVCMFNLTMLSHRFSADEKPFYPLIISITQKVEACLSVKIVFCNFRNPRFDILYKKVDHNMKKCKPD